MAIFLSDCYWPEGVAGEGLLALINGPSDRLTITSRAIKGAGQQPLARLASD